MLRPLLRYIAGGAAVLAGLGIAGLGVIEFGLFDVRASTAHTPLVAWATHTTMIHAVRRQASQVRAPARFSVDQVRAGFRLYDSECVACHGAPGIGRQTWVDGMTPSPPYLLDAQRHWSAAELDVIVADGVKMTGMPAWRRVHSGGEIWSIVAFLEALPNLTPRDYAALRAGNAPVGSQTSQTCPSSGRHGG